jgi:diketogulonate reductase-like aldo/keto reductase
MKNAKTTLSNGVEIPMIGLGVYDMYNEEAVTAVGTAIDLGYRLIDTAALYRNEKEVGIAVSQSNVPRDEIFITTKVGNTDHGYDQTLKAFDQSISLLNMDYVDLYLVHWPIPGKRKETWKALEYLYEQKRVRAIGVANYYAPFLDELSGYANIAPMVNQVEFSPFLQPAGLLDRCKKDNILLQAYTPLIRGKKMDDPRVQQLSAKYGKTPAQVILRWDIQHGVCPIPKSVTRARLEENIDVFDFEISVEDMKILDGCEEGLRICENPMDYLNL